MGISKNGRFQILLPYTVLLESNSTVLNGEPTSQQDSHTEQDGKEA